MPASDLFPVVNTLTYVRIGMLFALLISCMYTDLTSGRVYNWITIPAIPLALLIRFLEANFDNQLNTLDYGALNTGIWSAAITFLLFFFIWAIGALSGKPLLGGGDVKLMAAVGALTNLEYAFYVVTYSVFVAAIMAIWVLFRHGEVWAGMVGSFRRLVWPSHPSEVSPVEQRATGRTISFCTAICVGGMIAFFFYQHAAVRI